MSDESIVLPLVNQARRLQRDTEKLAFFEAAIRLNLRLKHAIGSVDGRELQKPVCVAFLGGTGTGKSSLFNAIVRIPEASPVSATRAFTKVPHVASTEEDFALLPELRSVGAQHVRFDKPGICLIDTPDLDSVLRTNREVARKVVQMADIIVYVTISDKVSDFEIDHEIREWASEKRWFFVMNKADLHQSTMDQQRAQFEGRLKEIGFEPDESCLFLVSAEKTAVGEFRDLQEAIYSSRTMDKVQVLRIDGTLGLLDNAVRSDVLDPIKQKADKFAEQEKELNKQVEEAYLEAFKTPEIEEIMRGIVREKTWQALSGRVGWIMGLVVWVKCRLDASMLAWQTGRLFSTGPSPLGMILLGITAVSTFWRGILPLRRISRAISPESRGTLSTIRAKSRHVLEDAGFNVEAAAGLGTNDETGEIHSAWVDAMRKIPFVGDAAANALQLASKTKFFDGELMAPLQKAIDVAAQNGAAKSVGLTHRIMTNLLPTIVLLDLARRFVFAWMDSHWLPWTFYGMAAAVFLLSLIPGYVLLSVAVNSRAKPPSAEEIVHSIRDPAGTAALRAFRVLLEQIVENAQSLQKNITRWRSVLDQELPTDRFGARQTKKS
jgi:GTP-binding protein EngB required for normal cell division